MKIKKNLKRLVSGVLSGAMLMTCASFLPEKPADTAIAASVCTVNTDKTYQRIRGFGGMNLPEWQGYDLTDEQIQTVFGNGDGQLGLTVLRIYISDDKNAWSKAIPTAKAAQKLGATIFATPWNPPSTMRHAGSGGTNGGKYVLNDNAEAQYAQHLNDYIKYVESQGVDLYSVSVQNEPDYSTDWTYWSPERTTNFIANYGQTVKAGTNAKLMSPETFQYGAWGNGRDYYNNILNNSKAMANVDLFGTHFYGTPRAKMDFPALENSGKEIWMTEVYVPNSTANSANNWPEAIQVAENIHNGLVVGNMSAYTWWYIRRSYSLIGQDDGKPTKRGYMMAQYSKYVRPGDVRIDCTEQPDTDLLVSAYKHSDTQIEIVAINKGSSDKTQQFSVNNRTITNVDRYRSSGSENLAATKDMEHDTSSFWATLPANSVSTFVITLTSDGKPLSEDPDQPVQHDPITPDANGCYYHDTFENGTDEWEARGSSELVLSGKTPYQGTNALLIQNREKSWNGAQKTLDSYTFKGGDSYSFSVCVNCPDGNGTQNMMLSLQYTDASGTTKYDHIASAAANASGYLQLANTSYKLPEGSGYILYVESENDTSNFYIDEAIVAKDGTVISGPTAPAATTSAPAVTTASPATAPAKELILGDLNADGKVDILDLCIARQGLVYGFTDANAAGAADVDQNGKYEINDLVLINYFLLGKIAKFADITQTTTTTTTTTATTVPPVDFSAMAVKFGSVTPAASYKKDNEYNPLISQYFGADPGVMEYDGRVYVYMTDDHLIYSNDQVSKITYSSINCIRCISSDDLVNWTDHGLINAAGQNGAAKWAGNSWAPTACHKTINGKEKFFLYFANNANGIGVLTADSPTGPWTDPLGKALISRSTANCSSNDVVWLFDPAVLVDDDGKAYLYFGGGIDGKSASNPKTARAVQLGDDMTSIVGTPVTINAPYLFEDSGIHKYNGKYYYSYCTNFQTGGNNLGLTGGAIDYMVSDSPLGPFTYKGEAFKGIGTFFGTGGNNHHSFMKFKDQWYLFYHAQYLQDNMGYNGLGYRSTHVDKVTMNSDGTIKAVTGTKTGVEQVQALDPFKTVRAATFSHQGGIQISGSGDTTVQADKGDWFRVTGVDCGSSASSLTIKASAANGCIVKVCTGSASGTAVAYAEIPAGSSMQEITVPVQGLSGNNDLYFVFNSTASVDSWKLN